MTVDGTLAIVGFLAAIGGLVATVAFWDWRYAVGGTVVLLACAAISAFLDRKES